MKSLKQIYLLVFIFLFPLLAEADARLEQAQQLIDQGNLDRALVLTEQVLKEDSGNIEARFLKGLLLAKAERLADAEAVFNKLTEDHPELPEPYNNLAVVYAAQGKFDEAQESLRRAINTHPSYATAHENLGDIYAKMASRAYNEALELDDGNASAREKLLLIRNLFSTETIASGKAKPVAVAQAEPAVVTPKPAPKPVEAAKPGPVVENKPVSQPRAEIAVDPAVERMIYDWASAWSAQDVNTYLSFYSSRFIPPNGLSRAKWNEQRQVRLTKPSFIRVEVSSPRISMDSESRASASFVQAYASDNYQDQVKKNMQLIKENGRWRIATEVSQ